MCTQPWDLRSVGKGGPPFPFPLPPSPLFFLLRSDGGAMEEVLCGCGRAGWILRALAL